jgi:hypothetical protein
LTAIRQPWPHSHFIDDFPAGRREAPRCEASLAVTLSCDVSATAVQKATASVLLGETCNLGEKGFAVRVPANRIDNHYLNVIGSLFDLTLDLPAGPLRMLVTPRWCQKLSQEGVEGFMIGLRITEMRDQDWVELVRYVQARI